MAQIEAQFDEANKQLKNHNQYYLWLITITKTLRKKLASSEQRDKMSSSREEVVHLSP